MTGIVVIALLVTEPFKFSDKKGIIVNFRSNVVCDHCLKASKALASLSSCLIPLIVAAI